MSDSILYLAIVAIWAGFLIPAWLRRPHSARTEQELEQEPEQAEYDQFAEDTTSDQPIDAVSDITADTDTHEHVEVPQPIWEYGDDVHPHNYDPPEAQADQSQAAGPAAPRPAAPRPSQSREQMMRARRRMLTILTGLTLLTGFFVLTGLVQWWICVPPIAMLVLYVMLLREIAMADAELAAKRRAWEARQARAAQTRPTAWQRSQLVWESEPAEPSAEIIDISARVGDQLYDQYADAAVRAVGD
jgi:hypothetical protein